MEAKKILVVEDEKSLREALADILRLKNFLPLEAKNGREGVEVAFARHPDLILLDLIMPEMDGMTALKRIRESEWGEHVPVVILTNLSSASQPLIEDMATHKTTHYLIKSDWKLHDVVEKIEEILEARNTLL